MRTSNRTHLLTAVVTATIVAVVMAVVPAGAGNGDPMYLGQKNNASRVTKLIGKLSPQCRNRILLEVRETNLDAQLFFRDTGFRAISVLRDFYEDTTEDAYLMQYRYRPLPVEFQQDRLSRRMAG